MATAPIQIRRLEGVLSIGSGHCLAIFFASIFASKEASHASTAGLWNAPSSPSGWGATDISDIPRPKTFLKASWV